MARRRSGGSSGFAALFILCAVSLFLFTVYVKEEDNGPLHTVQLGAAEVLRPVRGIFSFAAQPLDSAGSKVGGALDQQEAEELRRQVQTYREDAADAARLREENAQLREMLEGTQTGFEYAPLARVVAPIGGRFTDRVVVNVGTADGVEPEQPVIVGDNTLVGRTTGNVSRNTAEVMLITDQTFAAGVRIIPGPERGNEQASGSDGGAGTAGEGLLRTSIEGYLGVDLVDLGADVQRGDYVVTSGRAGDMELIFPPGLLVGTVESSSSQDIDQFKKIVVTPAVRPDDLHEVRVITGW